MREQQLFLQDGTALNQWRCAQCGMLWGNQELAKNCCNPRTCEICGEEIPPKSYHIQCSYERYFQQAEKLTEWDGPVWHQSSSSNNGYFERLADFLEWCDEQGAEVRPRYVWACHVEPFPGLDMNDALDSLEEEMYDDARNDFAGTKALYEAAEAFNALNKNLVSWHPNMQKAVLIPEAQQPDPQQEATPYV